MCFSKPKVPTPQVAPPPVLAPLAPELPVDGKGSGAASNNLRKSLRIDLSNTVGNVGGSGLNIPI